MLNNPTVLSPADPGRIRSTDMVAGYKCPGNSPRAFQALSSCGRFQGVPLRDLVKIAAVDSRIREEWLSETHLQEDRYVGDRQTRWHRPVIGVGRTGEDFALGTQWMETEITRIQLKSAIARMRKIGTTHQVLGSVPNDGTPLKSVEVKIDEGSWLKATMYAANSEYSWKRSTYKRESATPGPHNIVSGVTDVDCNRRFSKTSRNFPARSRFHSERYP